MIAGLYYGITMVIPPTFRPHQVWQEIAAEKISFFHASPFHFAVLANMPAPETLTLPEFKLCYSSGNRLPPNVAQAFEERFGITIDERYGTSEVGGICRSGFPLKGVHIKLLDEQGKRITEQGGIGEIVVKTPLMVTEYYNLPDLSHQAFRDGWFHTGDVGKIDQEGRLKILYRKKRTFVIDGQLVYADKIERTLRRHPQVKEVRVVRDKAQSEDVILKALVVLKEPCPQEVRVQDFLRSRLARHKIPQQIEFLSELPRSWKLVIAGMQQAYPKWGEL
jgi:long-chain acyl-CoA synthetase